MMILRILNKLFISSNNFIKEYHLIINMKATYRMMIYKSLWSRDFKGCKFQVKKLKENERIASIIYKFSFNLNVYKLKNIQ